MALRGRTRTNGKIALLDFREIQLAARVFDIDSDQIARFVVVQDHAAGSDLATVNTHPLGQPNIEGVSIWIIVQLHGEAYNFRRQE